MTVSAPSIQQAIATFLKLPLEQCTEPTLLTHLVNDSFILVQLVIELQEVFSVRLTQADLQPVQTVGELISLIQQKKLS